MSPVTRVLPRPFSIPVSVDYTVSMRDLARGLRAFWNDSAGRTVLGVAVTMVGHGTVFYGFVEDVSWIDSLYFCVITLTTVGYGDISPATTAGKVFTIIYAVMGIGVFVALVSTTAHHIIEAKQQPSEA